MTLFGYGKTTQAIAKRFKNCTIYDDSFKQASTDSYGNILLPSNAFNPQNSTLEVTSPGIPPHHSLIQKAQNLRSEYDLFAKTMPRSIWISGSNGKTTTTKMVDFLLPNSQAGGNVGLPLAQMDEDKALWVLESSSFTLHYTNIAKPDIYLLLPITPDHQSWHGSFEKYESAKLKPLQKMQEGELAILPQKYRHIQTYAYTVYYETPNDIARYFGIELQKIRFKGGFLLDSLLALATTKVLYDDVDYEKINAFTLDAHRQEKVCDTRNRAWINDSKATNVEATLAAIESFEGKKIRLIVGGEDKGADLTLLFEALPKDTHIYAIGKNAAALVELSKAFGLEYSFCQTLENAVKAIDTVLTKDEIALLSPAAASFDQFDNYEHRGDSFKAYIKHLKR
jgi:UDP-N-acetylmuramoylalanine--D-glutamate ligase